MESCPSHDLLSQFAIGDVSTAVMGEIETHLEHCSACQTSFNSIDVSEHDLVDIVSPYKEEAELADVVQSLKQIKQPVSTAEFKPSPILKQVGDFRILEELGRGGMGVVYLAEQISLNRKVALKTLPQLSVLDEHRLRRFENEARAAASLSHDHIVSVFLIGKEEQVHYYVMRYIEGRTLGDLIMEIRNFSEPVPGTTKAISKVASQIISSKPAVSPDDSSLSISESTADTAHYIKSVSGSISDPFPDEASAGKEGHRSEELELPPLPELLDLTYFQKVANLGIQAAEALDYAHSEGIIHRDIKPSNLLIDENMHLWVTDFGLARIESEASQSFSKDIIGTIRYMSPEQALGDRSLIDSRTDIYSLGATLYELATLEPIFEGLENHSVLAKLPKVEPRNPRAIQPGVPRDLETIILKAISKEAHKRYETAGQLAEDLRCFLEHRPISAKPPTPWERATKWLTRNPLVAALGMTITLSVSILAIILGLYNQQLSNVNFALEESNASLATTVSSLEDSQSQLQKSLGLVKSHEQNMKLRLYSSDMKLAMQALKKQDMPNVRSILSQYEEDDELRGFEWYYLKRHTLMDHVNFTELDSELYAMRISPDRQQIAIGDSKSMLRFLNIDSQTEVDSVFTDQSEINDIAYSPGGNRIATIGHDGTLKVWGRENLDELFSTRVVNEIGKVGYAVLFSPDGNHLITTNNEQAVLVWDSNTGEQVASLGEFPRSVEAITFSPDGTTLVTASDAGYLKFWDVSDWELKRAVPVKGELGDLFRLTTASFSPDGRLIATGNVDRDVFIVDVESYEIVTRRRHLDGITSVRFSPNGRWLSVADRGGSIICWPVEKEKHQPSPGNTGSVEPVTWPAHASRAIALDFLDNDQLFSVGWDGKLALWNPFIKNINLMSPPDGEQVNDFALLPDGQHYLTVNSKGEVKLWDSKEPQTGINLFQYDGAVLQVQISNDLNWLAIREMHGTVYIWNLASGEPAHIIKSDSETSHSTIQFSPDSKSLSFMKIAKTNSLYDLRAREVRDYFDVKPGWAPSFSPDARLIALIKNHQVHISNYLTGELLHTIDENPDLVAVDVTMFTLDGSQLITGGTNRLIKFWDVQSGKLLRTFSGHQSSVVDLCLSPDGRTLVSGDQDGHVKFWQMETGLEKFELPDRTRIWDFKFAFAPSGRKLFVWPSLWDSTDDRVSIINTFSPDEQKAQPRIELPSALLKPLPVPVQTVEK